MNGFSDKKFLENYFKTDSSGGEKMQDNFQTCDTKLLPFTLNPLSGCVYDGTCGLLGVAGEFYRLKTQSDIEPIYSVSSSKELVAKELKSKYKMPDEDIERFIKVFEDVMFEDDSVNVIDPSFFAYVPMKFFDKSSREISKLNKYRSGQPKIAQYYTSIAEEFMDEMEKSQKDLFCDLVSICLQKDNDFKTEAETEKYFVLPFIKHSFAKDLEWLLKQSNGVVVKYMPLMLYFYACYSLIQTLSFMNKKNWGESISNPKKVTYMLTSEKATHHADAVRKGWMSADVLPESFLNKMSSYAQALDILNLLFEDKQEYMTFQDILALFDAIDFEKDIDARSVCERVLSKYQHHKRELLKSRTTETGALPDEIDTTVLSGRQFVDKLLDLCVSLQSKDYPRMKHAMYSLAYIKLLESRKEYKVLVLDEDMLLFLVAMMAKDERIRIDDLYRRFESFGICFSFQTKNAICDYLQKLNLLERKSDSGEAQYVRVVL